MTGTSAPPDFVIAGMMRCGTTSLSSWLRHHPEICLSATKEVHYFDRHYERGPEWYALQFSRATSGQLLGEATPNYVYDELALERLSGDVPEVRIVLLLRDPVERAHSHYLHNVARARDELPFEEAVRSEERRLREEGAPAREAFSYVDRGRYLQQLARVHELFPSSRIQIHLFEDLRDVPGDVFRHVAAFLGVEATRVPPEVGHTVNAYQQFRSVRLRDLARHLPKPARDAVGRLNRVADPPYPEMSDSARQFLVRQYACERSGLRELLGRDLHEWQG